MLPPSAYSSTVHTPHLYLIGLESFASCILAVDPCLCIVRCRCCCCYCSYHCYSWCCCQFFYSTIVFRSTCRKRSRRTTRYSSSWSCRTTESSLVRDVTLTETELLIGKTTNKIPGGDVTTTFPALIVSVSNYNTEYLSTNMTVDGVEDIAFGELFFCIEHGSYSRTAIAEVNPLDIEKFLGNICGFWCTWRRMIFTLRAWCLLHDPLEHRKDLVSSRRKAWDMITLWDLPRKVHR
ncbi:unnamed protein product [Ectocarpus sp. 13 AM-2016]